MKLNDKIINQFKEALKTEGLRFTSQRLAVLEDIVTSSDHRDCDQIHLSINKGKNKVSKATVYRTVDVLLEHNFVRKLQIGDSAKYESKLDSPHHDHMICIETGDIIEFVDDRIERIQEQIAKDKGYKIIKHVHQLFVKPIKK
tara:strand:+ start:1073 stop:1501 length:429 start_codon:yes stop_codon:yes gene_type:complete